MQPSPRAATDLPCALVHQPAALDSPSPIAPSGVAAGSVSKSRMLTMDDVKSESETNVATHAGGGAASLTMNDDNSQADEDRTKSGSMGNANGSVTVALGKEGRFCVICGDCAVGCNFNAITCGSCKAFFRRNATKGKMLKCMFSGNCVMNVNTRRFCTACRLSKCFTMGMKPDLILDEEEKRVRKEKVLINREKKLHRLQQMQRAAAGGSCVLPAPCATAMATSLSSGREENDDDDDRERMASSRTASTSPLAVDTNGDSDVSMDNSPTGRATGFSGSSFGICSHADRLKEVPPSAAADGDRAAAATFKMAVGTTTPSSMPVAVEHCASSKCGETVGQAAGCQHCCRQRVPSSNGRDSATAVSDQVELAPVRENCVSNTAEALLPARSGCSAVRLSSATSVAIRSLLSDSDLQMLYSESCFSMPTVYPPSAQRRLTAEESHEIAELERAYATTFGEVISVQWDEIKPTSSLEYLINFTTAGMRRMVSFAKGLKGFGSLSQDVQVALLKAGSVACLTIRSAQSYDPERRCWDDRRGRVVSLDLIDQVLSRADPVVARRHGALMASIKRLVPTRPQQTDGQCDLAVFSLLLAITLLSPEHVSSQPSPDNDTTVTVSNGIGAGGDVLAFLSDAQQRYILLLGRHLEATYSYAMAADLLPSLLQHLAMCKRYGAHMRRWLGSRNVVNIDPLLKEVYCLKPPPASSSQSPTE